MGEIARGHWGLCKASITDLLSMGIWKGLDGRLIFAPVTAMTDDTMIRSRQEMEDMRRVFTAGQADEDSADGEDEEEVDTSLETEQE